MEAALPRKSKKPLPAPLLAVEEAVMTWEPMCATPHENGFHLARVVQGALGRAGVNPRKVSPHTAATHVSAALRDHCQHDFKGVVEALAASWGAVGTPEGWHPVEWAVQRFRWVKKPRRAPGAYVTKQQRDMATCLWYTFTHLKPDHNWMVYASLRTIATYTGVSHEYINCTLKLMVQNNLLQVGQKHTQAAATRYLLLHCPVDRGS